MFLGGGIEEGETPEHAVIRELKEECRVDGFFEVIQEWGDEISYPGK